MDVKKTPVSLLEEFCQQQKCGSPVYEEIEMDPQWKTFRYIVNACDYTAQGDGNSKKEAKHAACTQLINYLRQTDRFKYFFAPASVARVELPSKPDFNAVSALLELCIKKNWPVAQFNEDFPATGPPHNPIFTVSCSVGRNEEIGKAATKKGARQVAAAKMLKFLQSRDENDSGQLPVQPMETEEPEKIWRLYREWKRRDLKIEKTNLYDRHDNFLHIPDDVRKACYDILSEPTTEFHSDRDSVDRICKKLALTYKVSNIPNHSRQHKCFVLDGDFDVVLVDHRDKLYARIIDYFKTMMNFHYIAV